MKLFLDVAFLSSTAVTLAIPALIWLDPCSPPFLLSIMKDCASITWSIRSLGMQHLVILLEFWMTSHIILGGTFEIVYILFAGIVSMLNYFAVLRSNIQTARSTAELKYSTELYQSIQILEKMFNGFLMQRLIPVFMLLMPTLQILLQYVCVMMHGEIPMPAFLLFPITWVNIFVSNIFVFTLASWVNNISTKVLQELMSAIVQCRCGRRRSSLVKGVKACAVLKIKFGSNFIDSGTPLVIQDFCLTQTMSLILIDGSRNGY
ncbi:uncharacterized protein LOC118437013 [Folsomia candida]|uniref:uncharacterized protein LOC118437013 n=1 Tax=Folsomia candida TaxID=158441 RepID=UPI00160506AB|nr:uncharacterized protein LOC118437013 [Folsomia candida]